MIEVTVTRSGGFAGITRRWTVTLAEGEWDELTTRGTESREDSVSRDRFVYALADGSRTVRIPESRLDGRLRGLLRRPDEDGTQ
jgi:hypothetical protein